MFASPEICTLQNPTNKINYALHDVYSAGKDKYYKNTLNLHLFNYINNKVLFYYWLQDILKKTFNLLKITVKVNYLSKIKF